MSAALQSQLASIPHPTFHSDNATAEDSVRYLASADALDAVRANAYWPKWNGPWWHMLLLHERGEGHRIPTVMTRAMVASLDAMPVKIFPIHPHELPRGVDVYRDTSCHCALGCVVPILLACGVDVDGELPWIRAWFVRYQMADGGLNCDPAAYLCGNEVPSSMVGTVAPMEAMLDLTKRRATTEDVRFLDDAARFLIHRQLTRGSDTVHNAEERVSALQWPQPTFPRFYFYDVLRGLSVLTEWANRFHKTLPLHAVQDVAGQLASRFPDGLVRVERNAHAGKQSIFHTSHNVWSSWTDASSFPLLEASSGLGTVSPSLTREWSRTRTRILQLMDAGRLV